MSESLYTKKEHAQFRGPTNSDHYNDRVEALYKDLVFLYNKIGSTEEDVVKAYQRIFKSIIATNKYQISLDARLRILESGDQKIQLTNSSQEDVNRFTGTAFEVSSTDRCFFDPTHCLITLPRVIDSSISKVQFLDSGNNPLLPGGIDTRIVGNVSSADNNNATIDSSDVNNIFINLPGNIWERNVVSNSTSPNGAVLNLYVKLPTDLSITADTNSIIVNPYPAFGCDIINIAYSTSYNVLLTEADGYTTINSSGFYQGENQAIGQIPPGGWPGSADTIYNSGPKKFYFDPKPITAIRITMRQPNYHTESGKYIYTYGMAGLDVRFDKFLATGKTILKYDAEPGKTISEVTNITPQVWNVSPGELPYVFSQRVIWETSFNSGVYTTTPVPFSKRVWVEVTLNQTSGKGTPSLTGLVVDYK